MALDWTSIGTFKFDVRPRLSGVGQASTLGANSVACSPSGSFSSLGGIGFPMHVPSACAGLVGFGFGPHSNGTAAVQGPSMNSINVPAINPQSSTIAVLAEIVGSKSTDSYGTSSGMQNQGMFSFDSGGNSGAAVGIDRTVRFANGVGPGGGDWWLWNASTLRVPCNLQLMVFRRNGGDVTINTASNVSETITTADAVVTSTQQFSCGSLVNNNACIGNIIRWTAWSGQLSDGNVTSLYDDVYAMGGLAPSDYTGDVVIFGDSITAGAYGLPGQTWVSRLLASAHAAKKRVWNYARSGEKMNGGLATSLANAISSTNTSTLTQSHLKFLFGNSGENFPSGAKVVIALGANDLYLVGGGGTLTGAQICLGLQAACQLLKSWGATIYYIAPIPLSNSVWSAGVPASVETTRRALITAAQALIGTDLDAVMTWDGTDLEPTAASDTAVNAVTTGPAYQLFTSNSSNLMHTSNQGDRLHAGPIGQLLMGSSITRWLMPKINVSTTATTRPRNRNI